MAEEVDVAVRFFRRVMTPDDTLLIKDLSARILSSPPNNEELARCLLKYCSTVDDLKEFFDDNSHHFYLENGRVALYSDWLENAANLAEEYFKGVLSGYDYPVDFMTLKVQHLGNADDDVKNFITRFYPNQEFKKFLKQRPNVFTVDKNHNVTLIEVESVAFYKKMLEKYGKKHFSDFRGHIGHALPHVQKFINSCYKGNDFQIFLRRNSNVFHLDEEGIVSLVPLNQA